jgi:hypothetical protein
MVPPLGASGFTWGRDTKSGGSAGCHFVDIPMRQLSGGESPTRINEGNRRKALVYEKNRMPFGNNHASLCFLWR